jgi:hypothetical protein
VLAAHKLAEWIGENLQEALRISDKADKLASPGTGWTPDGLNHILQEHVVDEAGFLLLLSFSINLFVCL